MVWLNVPDGMVSIHAPVKGATNHVLDLACVVGVSIHAPVKGATSDSSAHTAAKTSFQSTPP